MFNGVSITIFKCISYKIQTIYNLDKIINPSHHLAR
ncbi:hypothetical protein BVRB_4g071890 [Beta vulgaris subsp. vulgaris]|nr:hypothetical protein BVRB_4g071890 [Beta vulgaris subsp. vulgaris]